MFINNCARENLAKIAKSQSPLVFCNMRRFYVLSDIERGRKKVSEVSNHRDMETIVGMGRGKEREIKSSFYLYVTFALRRTFFHKFLFCVTYRGTYVINNTNLQKKIIHIGGCSY